MVHGAERVVEEMSLEEYKYYLSTDKLPLRHSFRPIVLPPSGYRGAGMVIDLGLNEINRGAAKILQVLDAANLRVSARCLLEFGRSLCDEEGHLAVGVLQVAEAILANLLVPYRLSQEGVVESDFGAAFLRLVTRDLQLHHFLRVNSGKFRDHVEKLLSLASGRSVEQLMSLLNLELSFSSRVRGKFWDVLDVDVVQQIINNTTAPGNSAHHGLHACIGKNARVAAGGGNAGATLAGKQHHFLVLWFVGPMRAEVVN